MSIHNLDTLFRPRSVALIGAGRRPGSVGAVMAKNLAEGGFASTLAMVNPHADEIAGVPCFPDVDSLPDAPDLAIIATPPDTVPGIVASLGQRGTRAAVVITAGFGEGANEEGIARRTALLDAARPHTLRIVGPNCVGLLSPNIGLNASFVHMMPNKGNIAFVTQSGAVVTAIVDWATPRGIGFSHIVSVGDMADVDFGDLLGWLADDDGTGAVLLYVEAVTHAAKFMAAARACARKKPVIVIKTGRHAESARAAASHTGALAGADAVYDAAFRRAGMLRVYDLLELFDAVETLSVVPRITGDRLAILTNGGGAGVLATDALIDYGGHMADLSDTTIAALDAVLPPTWSRGNPVDIIGDADGDRYAKALAALVGDSGIDAILAINCPTAVASSTAAAASVADGMAGQTMALLTCWLGDSAVSEGRRLFNARNIPTFNTPAEAARGFMHMVEFHRNQTALARLPERVPVAVDSAATQAAIDGVLSADRDWLTEHEAKSVLAAYGIAVAQTIAAADPDEAADAAVKIGKPVAIKILSPDLTHKTDVGGVVLDLDGAEPVRTAARAMLDRVAAARPEARITGIAVEPMIRREAARELIVGTTVDPQFGPVILFGHGGTAVEAIGDTALALPPLDADLAMQLMRRTRVWRLLQGLRGAPPADLDAIADVLVRISALMIDQPAVVELDINPLLADAKGAIALDARIRVSAEAARDMDRLALRGWPSVAPDETGLPG